MTALIFLRDVAVIFVCAFMFFVIESPIQSFDFLFELSNCNSGYEHLASFSRPLYLINFLSYKQANAPMHTLRCLNFRKLFLMVPDTLNCGAAISGIA